MLKNFFKIGIRNLGRSKAYAMINIMGLAVGMASVILIFLWVQHEVSYDRFHEYTDNIYRVVQTQHYSGDETFEVSVTPSGLAHYLREKFPEIVNVTRATGWSETFLVESGEKKFNEDINLVDPEFFDMFSFPFVKGDAKTALNNVHSIVLTESSAKKYFGEENPLGKAMRIMEKFEFTVTGVIKDMPSNSFCRNLESVIPFKFYKDIGTDIDNLGNNSYYTFIHLSSKITLKEMNEKLKPFLCEVREQSEDECSVELYLQPFKNMHLYWLSGGGRIQQVRLFSLIAIFILIIACINFINLSTAIATKRMKEVGVKKVVGANKKKIILQFLSETILLSIIAMFFALLFVETINTPFNNLIGKELSVNYFDLQFILGLLGIIIFTGVIAGIYPAFYVSSFAPARILKSKSIHSKHKFSVREILVVFQFMLAIILIVSTITTKRQMTYMLNKDQGLNKDHVIRIFIEGSLKEQYDVFKKELLQLPEISMISIGSNNPIDFGSNGGGWSWPGSDEDSSPLVSVVSTGYDYAKIFDIKLVEGEYFSEGVYHDTLNLVINKAFADLIGIKPIVGQVITRGDSKWNIKGVVKDFHFQPANQKIGPLAIYNIEQWSANRMFIKISPDNISETIRKIEAVYTKFNPNYPFDYWFLNEDFKNLYSSGIRLGKIFNYFSFLAIFISCLGLYGLVSFSIQQKTKEMGIRKVNGAMLFQLVIMHSKEFSKWILFSFIIACPIAYYLMNKYLQESAYRIDLNVWPFIYAGLLAFGVAIITVGLKVYYAARRNPVESLRYE